MGNFSGSASSSGLHASKCFSKCCFSLSLEIASFEDVLMAFGFCLSSSSFRNA